MKQVYVICGSDCKTVKQQKVHNLLRICEKQIAQKLLNAAKLLQDHVYTETAVMCGTEDVFAVDIYYHSYCCKDYVNKYNLKIAELDFQNTAYSLSFIRDKLPVSQDRISVGLRSKVKCQELIRMGPMKHRGEIDVSAQDTFTVVTSNGEPNSSTLDECPFGNVSIASGTNTTETVTTTPEADAHLTTSPITDASGIPSIKSISLDYFLWLVNRLSKRIIEEDIQDYLKEKSRQFQSFAYWFSSYRNGGFVVNTNRTGSGVRFDQALEQSYNRPAKVSRGIIGVTRKKDAVALWGIIKHKKDEYVHLFKMQDGVDGELFVHHNFNQSSAKKIKELVQDFEECPYRRDCVQISKHLASKADIKDKTIKALIFIEYGCHCGFPAEELLVHEITSSAFFLVDKDRYVKKSVKSQLGTELLKLCPEIDAKGLTTPNKAYITDFMAMVRKTPFKELEPPVKIFNDLAVA
ncbi:Hypothetical predicted protein [Paramuricea clavata]|uniref:Uncharacterized protein n=1 Tax=Paramuricea clavata TaxID=317549 RepID=A0A6S7G9U8_PARCT|nr:Hypothetical predicted protein [Paramuricea clavata]